MLNIFKRELLDQLTSFKFFAGLLLVLVLFGLNGLVFSLRYRNEVIEFRQVQQRWEQQLAEKKNLDNVPNQQFDSLKEPLKTAFLASGGQYRLPNDYRFTINIGGTGPPPCGHSARTCSWNLSKLWIGPSLWGRHFHFSR
jgi:hypothetical protein